MQSVGMLGVIIRSVVMLGVIMLSVTMFSFIIPYVAMQDVYTKCHNAWCRYAGRLHAGCCYAECPYV